MSDNSQSKFFLVARSFGGLPGRHYVLPDGTKYSGTLWANQGDKGVWYSTGRDGLVPAEGHEVLAEPTRR